jgi:hypothetical protein
MLRKTMFAILLAMLAAAWVMGCSQNEVVQPADTGTPGSGVVDGDVDPGAGEFEFVSRTAGDPNHPIEGPFIIRGSNVHYNDVLGALVLDLTVTNAGRVAHPEPISLTFVHLRPEGVTVLNPDNGEHGPGAAIVFQFTNRDVMWTPGESSLPRTVQFGVERGKGIGFVARLDVGMAPTGGSIGGLVWLDMNENGEVDSGEEGIGGVDIMLLPGGAIEPTNVNIIAHTRTARDGTYRFDGLRAGFYTVFKASLQQYRPTTPTVWHVALTQTEGGVSDFLMANFGCVKQEPPVLNIGGYVQVAGRYDIDDLGRIIARQILVDPFDERMMRPAVLRPGELRGEVTDISRDRRALAIMGEWVSFAHMYEDSSGNDSTAVDPNGNPPGDFADILPFEDVNVGDRVWAIFQDMPAGTTTIPKGMQLMRWGALSDHANGQVRRRSGSELRPLEIILFSKTRVVITPDTQILPLDY